MHQVSQILEEKGHNVLQIEADASVYEAVRQMVAANVASLLVTEGGEITRDHHRAGLPAPGGGRGTHGRGNLRSGDHVLAADCCHPADVQSTNAWH